MSPAFIPAPARIPAEGRLAAKETGLLREGVSPAHGRLVRVSLDCGKYQGARPYFTVAYFQKDGRRPQVARFTPFQDRAEWLFARFLEDVTDPATLVLSASHILPPALPPGTPSLSGEGADPSTDPSAGPIFQPILRPIFRPIHFHRGSDMSRRPPRSRARSERRCGVCGRRFRPCTPRQLYCGKRCATEALSWDLEAASLPPHLRGKRWREWRPE